MYKICVVLCVPYFCVCTRVYIRTYKFVRMCVCVCVGGWMGG